MQGPLARDPHAGHGRVGCFLLPLQHEDIFSAFLPSHATPHSTTKLWKTELFVYELARSCQPESIEIACNTLRYTKIHLI